MRSDHGVGGFALALLACGCAASRPAWYPGTPHRQRESAYDWFLVATGTGAGRDRDSSCDVAALDAWGGISKLFLEEAETASEVVAVAGGPSRVHVILTTFLERVFVEAIRTEEVHDDMARRCYVELRWRLPRHLSTAIARTLELRDTEESVGQEIKKALQNEDAPVAPQKSAAPTPEAAIAATYRGWFVRVVSLRDCDTHRLAFVGAPGGSEARWLELKQANNGWILIDDRKIGDEGWPTPPELSLCD